MVQHFKISKMENGVEPLKQKTHCVKLDMKTFGYHLKLRK